VKIPKKRPPMTIKKTNRVSPIPDNDFIRSAQVNFSPRGPWSGVIVHLIYMQIINKMVIRIAGSIPETNNAPMDCSVNTP